MELLFLFFKFFKSLDPAPRKALIRSVIHKTRSVFCLFCFYIYFYIFIFLDARLLGWVEWIAGAGAGARPLPWTYIYIYIYHGLCTRGVHFLPSLPGRRQTGQPPSSQRVRQRFVFIHMPQLAVVV